MKKALNSKSIYIREYYTLAPKSTLTIKGKGRLIPTGNKYSGGNIKLQELDGNIYDNLTLS